MRLQHTAGKTTGGGKSYVVGFVSSSTLLSENTPKSTPVKCELHNGQPGLTDRKTVMHKPKTLCLQLRTLYFLKPFNPPLVPFLFLMVCENRNCSSETQGVQI
jgi:hypothetical protein